MWSSIALLQITSASTAFPMIGYRKNRMRRYVHALDLWFVYVRPDLTTPRLETAKSNHKVFDLAGRRGYAGLKVTLNAQSGEEGKHHFGNCRRSHPGLFCSDIHGEKLLQ